MELYENSMEPIVIFGSKFLALGFVLILQKDNL